MWVTENKQFVFIYQEMGQIPVCRRYVMKAACLLICPNTLEVKSLHCLQGMHLDALQWSRPSSLRSETPTCFGR